MTNFTKIAKPASSIGRFGIAKFGQSKFGTTDDFTKSAKPTNSYTKIDKRTFGAKADFALADYAVVDTEDGFTKIAKP